MSKGYILSAQDSLFGQRDVIGFGDDDFCVREIDRDRANAIIVRNHYSKKFYSATYIHLGLFIDGEIYGVLQFGYAMNPASAGSVVEGTGMDEYLELNRMWLDDFAPHCSESRAISYAIKFIRRKYSKVKWIQSFADERCGKFGAVYQASGFRYYGEHNAIFWELDNIVYHNTLATAKKGKQGKAGDFLQANIHRAEKHELRQFRYLYFMQPRFAKAVKLKEQPFPKPNAAPQGEKSAPTDARQVQSLRAAPNSQVAA